MDITNGVGTDTAANGGAAKSMAGWVPALGCTITLGCSITQSPTDNGLIGVGLIELDGFTVNYQVALISNGSGAGTAFIANTVGSSGSFPFTSGVPHVMEYRRPAGDTVTVDIFLDGTPAGTLTDGPGTFGPSSGVLLTSLQNSATAIVVSSLTIVQGAA